jgi:hypothetical protein
MAVGKQRKRPVRQELTGLAAETQKLLAIVRVVHRKAEGLSREAKEHLMKLIEDGLRQPKIEPPPVLGPAYDDEDENI